MNSTLTETSRRFLNAVFPKGIQGQVWIANSDDWGGGPAGRLALDPAQGNYWSPATMKAGAGTRSNAQAERVYAIVADDVGARIDPLTLLMELPPGAPKPFRIVTTYRGCKLRPGEDAGENAALYDANGVALRDNEQWGWIIGGAGGDPALFVNPTLYRRLPQGVSPRNGSATVLVDDAGLSTPVDEALGVEIAQAIARATPGGKASAPSGKAPGHSPQPGTLAEVQALLDIMDNSVLGKIDYDTWITVGIAVWGSVGEAGRGPWVTWSRLSPVCGIKADPEGKWETFPAQPYAGFGALEIIARRVAGQAVVSQAVGRVTFDDGVGEPTEEELFGAPVDATAFVLLPGKTKARRPWLYGGRLVRGYVSGTVAAGGVGKSSLTIVEAISMASGVDILKVGEGRMPRKALGVWVWNGEDPLEELDLRVTAACEHHGVPASALGGRLFLDSGRMKPIKLVTVSGKGVSVDEALVSRLVRGIKARRIDVLIVDPLVSAHYANENDNMQMDLVVKTLGRIAGECGIAIEVVHHTRKGTGNGAEATVDDARGAGAVINAARNLRVLTPMSKETGERYGVLDYRSYFCVSKDTVKANLTPPLDSDHWYRMRSHDMGNGDPFPADGGPPIDSDKVGVCEKWALTVPNVDRLDLVAKAHKSMTGKQWRENWQTGAEWVGLPVADALGLDPHNKKNHKAIKGAIEKWLREGWLKRISGKRGNRQEVIFIEIGDVPSVEF